MYAERSKQKEYVVYGTISCMVAIVLIGVVFDSLLVLLLICFIGTLPLWLPYFVVRFRFFMFDQINKQTKSKQESIELPNEKFGSRVFDFLYNHPCVNIRSIQNDVGLSDFFWYLLAPADYIHQEHLESNTKKYDVLQKITKIVIKRYNETSENETYYNNYMKSLILQQLGNNEFKIVYLRQFYQRLFLKLIWKLVFGIKDECSEEECDILFGGGDDVISALKFLRVRNMKRRDKLTKLLEKKVSNGDAGDLFEEADKEGLLSLREKALFLQGVIFVTGSVQLSEGMAHASVCLAQEFEFDKQKEKEGLNIMHFIHEALRMYPLFGIAHRMTSQDITIPEKLVKDGKDHIIKKGTVVLFNYPKYHRSGYKNGNQFNVNRWNTIKQYHSNYMPFGAKNNRPCPAKNLSYMILNALLTEIVNIKNDINIQFFTPVLHTRTMMDGGLCLIVNHNTDTAAKKDSKNKNKNKNSTIAENKIALKVVLTGLWLYQQFMLVYYSLLQLVCGSYMLYDAMRHKKLAQTFFQMYKNQDEPVTQRTRKTDQ